MALSERRPRVKWGTSRSSDHHIYPGIYGGHTFKEVRKKRSHSSKPVRGITGRLYPWKLCFTKGDLYLHVYKDVPEYNDPEKDYVVERIVDAVNVRGQMYFLIKWVGYELDPGHIGNGDLGSWQPLESLSDAIALDEWESDPPPHASEEIESPVMRRIAKLLQQKR